MSKNPGFNCTILLEYIRYFCVQEIAFRGDGEISDSLNKGDFSELMAVNFRSILISGILGRRLKVDAACVDYLSEAIYNELVSLMASEVLKRIGDEVKVVYFIHY